MEVNDKHEESSELADDADALEPLPRAPSHIPSVAGAGTEASIEAAVPAGCVKVNVLDTTFVAKKATLEKCTYFASLFARWAGAAQEIEIDCEPDAFAALLRYMRSGYASVAIPRGTSSLAFATILALAEYLGMNALVEHVKARTYRNMNSSSSLGNSEAAALFDAQHGGIADALDDGTLPDRYFNSPPPPLVDGPVGSLRLEYYDGIYIKLRVKGGREEYVVIDYSESSGSGDADMEDAHTQIVTTDADTALDAFMMAVCGQLKMQTEPETFNDAQGRSVHRGYMRSFSEAHVYLARPLCTLARFQPHQRSSTDIRDVDMSIGVVEVLYTKDKEKALRVLSLDWRLTDHAPIFRHALKLLRCDGDICPDKELSERWKSRWEGFEARVAASQAAAAAKAAAAANSASA